MGSQGGGGKKQKRLSRHAPNIPGKKTIEGKKVASSTFARLGGGGKTSAPPEPKAPDAVCPELGERKMADFGRGGDEENPMGKAYTSIVSRSKRREGKGEKGDPELSSSPCKGNQAGKKEEDATNVIFREKRGSGFIADVS